MSKNIECKACATGNGFCYCQDLIDKDKNIDSIVESVLPEKMSVAFEYSEAFCVYENSRIALKQALTEKKLVVPMSELDMFNALYDQLDHLISHQRIKQVAKAIYERQFKGDE